MSFAARFTRIDADAAITLAREQLGLNASHARRFDTERDDSFLLDLADRKVVLKLAHPEDDPAVLDLQLHALEHLASAAPDLPAPRPVASAHGDYLTPVEPVPGEPRMARVLSYLPGKTLTYDDTNSAQRRALGRMLGRLSLALAEFRHPAAQRHILWDLLNLSDAAEHVGVITDPVARTDVAAVLAQFAQHTGPRLHATRRQIVHLDFNQDNVLVDAAAPDFVTGILDFGDLTYSSVVGDLAIAMAYAVDVREFGGGDPWAAPYDLAIGFQSIRMLDDEEKNLLPDLVRARLAQRQLLNSLLADTTPENAHYTRRSLERSAAALRATLATAPKETYA